MSAPRGSRTCSPAIVYASLRASFFSAPTSHSFGAVFWSILTVSKPRGMTQSMWGICWFFPNEKNEVPYVGRLLNLSSFALFTHLQSQAPDWSATGAVLCLSACFGLLVGGCSDPLAGARCVSTAVPNHPLSLWTEEKAEFHSYDIVQKI